MLLYLASRGEPELQGEPERFSTGSKCYGFLVPQLYLPESGMSGAQCLLSKWVHLVMSELENEWMIPET